jgi:dTDP-4-amino-4,6-dideoxygalactose transaminase
VAAARFAGLGASLLDLEAGTPWLQLSIEDTLLRNAAALVAVNFLGMRERIESLRTLAHEAGIPLIEDSAQMMPFAAGSRPTGDLVVYSFGRGKPLSLLGGGALLIRSDWADDFDSRLPSKPARHGSAAAYALRSMAHNMAIHPLVYGWVRRLPFLRIGEVAYHPLASVGEPDADTATRMASAWRLAAKTPASAQRLIAERIRTIRHLVDLPAVTDRAQFPLLRYPVLAADRESRDRLVSRLDRAGLGASRFYGSALTQMAGLPTVSSPGARNAEDFAARLLTLPVHADVRPGDVERMCAILEDR